MWQHRVVTASVVSVLGNSESFLSFSQWYRDCNCMITNWCHTFNIMSSFFEVFNTTLQLLSYIYKSKLTVRICTLLENAMIAILWHVPGHSLGMIWQGSKKIYNVPFCLTYLVNICNSDKYQTALENLQVFVACTVSQVLLGGHLFIYWFASQTILLHSTNGK